MGWQDEPLLEDIERPTVWPPPLDRGRGIAPQPREAPQGTEAWRNAPFLNEVETTEPTAADVFKEPEWRSAPIMNAKRDYAIEEVPLAMVGNFPQSAKKEATAIGTAALHPIETGKTMGQLGIGLGSYVAQAPEAMGRKVAADLLDRFGLKDQAEQVRNTETPMGWVAKTVRDATGAQDVTDVVIKDYVDAYGGWENIKRTAAEDPVRFLSDVAMIASLTGMGLKTISGRLGELGLTGAAKVTAKAGTAAEAVSAVNPVSLAAGGVELTAKGLANIGTLRTWAGRLAATKAGQLAANTAATRAIMKALPNLRTMGGSAAGATWAMQMAKALAAGTSTPIGWAGTIALVAAGPEIAGVAEGVGKSTVQAVIASERTMRALGIAPRVAAIATSQTGYVTDVKRDHDVLVKALTRAAGELNYKLHPSVINKLASKLIDEDPATYRSGINAEIYNRRLFEVVAKAGDNAMAEQQEAQAGGQ